MCGACEKRNKINEAMALTCHGPVGVEEAAEFAERVLKDTVLKKVLIASKTASPPIPISLHRGTGINMRADMASVSLGTHCASVDVEIFLTGLMQKQRAE